MAEKEEGFMRYMMMQQEIAKEKQQAEAARQEMEDLLVGRGNAGQQGQLGGHGDDGWADCSDNED